MALDSKGSLIQQFKESKLQRRRVEIHTYQSESHQSATTILAWKKKQQTNKQTNKNRILLTHYSPQHMHTHTHLSHEKHDQQCGQQQVVSPCLEVPEVCCHSDSPMGLFLSK